MLNKASHLQEKFTGHYVQCDPVFFLLLFFLFFVKEHQPTTIYIYRCIEKVWKNSQQIVNGKNKGKWGWG